MSDWLTGCIAIIGGVAVIMFRKKIIPYYINYQNKYLGNNFGPKTIKFYTKFAILFGLILAAIGVLMILGLGDDVGITKK